MVEVERLLSRRAALTTGAGVAAVTVTGCGTPSHPGAGTSTTEDSDLRLLRRALQREDRVREEARATSRRQPRLREQLRPLLAVHDDHRLVLSRSMPGRRASTTRTDAGPRRDTAEAADAADAARALARSERALAEAHAGAALEARSGPFARVLAGMAAAAEQQAHVLDGLALAAPTRG